MFTHATKKQSTVTKWKLFTVFFCQINEGYQINVILPFVVFMIRDFDISEENVGFMVGALTASFMFCQFICSFAWGWYSDIYGRRSALLIGQICGAIAIVVFGASTSYAMAMTARCIGGIMNGNIGVMKAWVADISDASNRGFSFSIIAIGWGAGSILGATLGGLLVISYDLEEDGYHKPSKSVLNWWVFSTYAYLLPCVLGGIMATVAIIWTLLFVKDEVGTLRATKKKQKQISLKNGDTTKWSMSRNDSKQYSHHELKSIDLTGVSKSLPSYSTANNNDSVMQYSEDDSFESQRKGTRNYSLLQYESAAYTIDTMNDTLRLKDLINFSTNDKQALLDNNKNEYSEPEIHSVSDLFSQTKLLRTLIAIMTYAMFSMLWNQLAPIYVAQSLDFNSTETGIVMAFGAATLSIFTFFVQPYFLKHYSYKRMSIVSTICLFFVVLLMPSISLLKNDEKYNLYLLLGCTCILHGSKYAFSSILFVTTICFLNNSVPPSQCGRANGIAQAFAALMRGIGPLTGGAIWSWSMSFDDDSWVSKYKAYPAYLFTFLFLLMTTFVLWWFIDDTMQIPWEDKMAKLCKDTNKKEQDEFD
eukprot:121966_1